MVGQPESSSPSWFSRLSTPPAGHGEKYYAEEAEDVERAFQLADTVEKGNAREIATDFMQPLRRSSKLWRFNVVRSADKLQYRLFSADGDFLIYARINLEASQVGFFLYNPGEGENTLYDPSRPAFTMTHDKEKIEWRLISERCEHCTFLPRNVTCAAHGKQEVACFRQSRTPVGDGTMNCMDACIPGLYSDGSRVLWCPMLRKGELGSACEGDYEVQRLVTKQPQWNSEVESLVLDFKGRNIMASAKNFQLALQQKPQHVILQFGKIGPSSFSLDLRYPMSVIQAFAASMTTVFWT